MAVEAEEVAVGAEEVAVRAKCRAEDAKGKEERVGRVCEDVLVAQID